MLMLFCHAEHGDFGLIAALLISVTRDDVEQNDGHHGEEDKADVDPEEGHDGFIACCEVQRIEGFFSDKCRSQNDNEYCIRGCSGRGASFFDSDQ